MSAQNVRPDPAASPARDTPSGQDRDRDHAAREDHSQAEEKEPPDDMLVPYFPEGSVSAFILWVEPDELGDDWMADLQELYSDEWNEVFDRE